MLWLILSLLSALLLRPIECPDIPLGTTGILRSGDVFAGRPIEVFQLAWTTAGDETYVVLLLPDGGYLGATGCEIEVK